MSIKPNRIWVLLTTAALVSRVGAGTVWNYLRTAHQTLGQSLRDAVPIDFELKRLEQMTADLIPEIRTNQKVAAQLEVEIDYLEKELQTAKQAQADARSRMK